MTLGNTNLSKPPKIMSSGGLGELICMFVTHLNGLGYTQLTIKGYADSARHFAAWLNRTGIDISDVDEQIIEQFSRHDCSCGGNRRCRRLSGKYVNRVRCFVQFLGGQGIVTVKQPAREQETDETVIAFQNWLRRHRGLSELTISRHGRMVMRLLPSLGTDSASYDAGLIRQTIIKQTSQCSRSYVKTMTTALRCYLRFLISQGLCRSDLDQAVPTIPEWRLSTLPRYLDDEDVKCMVASCDLTTNIGIRDYAILLLLTGLGLRAGDVLAMRLDDIAWTEGTVRVRGKGRREVLLPLPQDAGDALLKYIEYARPYVDEQRIFLRSIAPYHPFNSSSALSSVVRRALERSGIDNPPSRGANLLRHSAATRMLRAGATLDAIGAVLRHRCIDTTAHYAKVNIPMLCEIAQPWPGDV